MSNANFRWHFPSTDGGDEDGINNSGLQTFEGNHESAIARECIQNSLDAIKDQNLPVRVQMHFFEMNMADIPGIEELKQDIMAAKNYAGAATGADRFFAKALKAFNNTKVSILRIGDYNTRGLVGEDNKAQGGSWYSLVRSTGFSQKNASDSGGSFGIGKSAPFVASDIRTVFYSTLNENGEHIFQGKAYLASFEQDGDIKRGTGQYGKDLQNGKGVASIRNEAEIPERFRRRTTGTDIFVVGYQHPEGDWKEALIKAILDNFFVAIYYKKLVVEICDTTLPTERIDADSLAYYITTYFKDENSEESATKAYYQAIVDSTVHFTEDLPPFGNVELFIKKGTGDKTVLGMRKPLMKIHTFKSYRRVYEDFAGVLIVRDDNGNKLLKSIEPPAHNEWDPKLCRMDNCATPKDFETLRKWIRQKLEFLNGDANKHPEEIYDLAKYLPYEETDSDMPSTASSNGNPTAPDTDRETADDTPLELVVQPFAQVPEQPLVFIKPASKTADTPSGTNSPTSPGTNKGARGSKHATNDPNGNTKFLDPANLNVKIHEVRRNDDRVYIFNIVPKSDDNGDIQIIAIADDNSYPVDVLSAKNITTGQEYETNKSVIHNVTTEAQKTIKIEIRLTKQYSKRRYILGVR